MSARERRALRVPDEQDKSAIKATMSKTRLTSELPGDAVFESVDGTEATPRFIRYEQGSATLSLTAEAIAHDNDDHEAVVPGTRKIRYVNFCQARYH